MSFEEASFLASLLPLTRTDKYSIFGLPGEISSYFAKAGVSFERATLASYERRQLASREELKESPSYNKAETEAQSQETPFEVMFRDPWYTELVGENTCRVSAKCHHVNLSTSHSSCRSSSLEVFVKLLHTLMSVREGLVLF